MKRAKIRSRRTLADGKRLVQIVCPICDHRHWMHADVGDTAHCIRGLPGKFTVGAKRRHRANAGAWQ